MTPEIIEMRHELHKFPELANNEFETAVRIENFISRYKPDSVVNLASTGKAFIFEGKDPGKTVMFRSELDALPIIEKSDEDYASANEGVAHLCGHDGHMSILLGLAHLISENRPKKGRVILLYQPAEESEQGARDVVNDSNFEAIAPDYIFALHNIPGVEKHTILLKNGAFAAASKGMTIKLYGKTSHAAEPYKGISPADAIAKIITRMHELRANKALFSDLALLTIINIKLGEIAFGTSPGYAEIRVTLRSFENADMDFLTAQCENIVKDTALEEDLGFNIEYNEVFPGTVNDDECFEMIKNAAEQTNTKIQYIETPFRWSEDFGYYCEKYTSGFFGLGAGVMQPSLHNPDYDFPDDIIETGAKMFFNIYKQINL
jgi:amidohydrolase